MRWNPYHLVHDPDRSVVFWDAEELAGNWRKNGGNHFNQNSSALTAMNRENVEQLKAVWRVRLDGSGAGARYSGSAQPLVPD